jgi:hypothetical protein
MLGLVLILGAIGLMVLTVLFRAWVLTVMWGWFMPTLFHLPPLTISAAIGVSCVIVLLTHQREPAQKEEPSAKQQIAASLSQLFLAPLVLLFVAYLAKCAMGE